MSGKDVGIRKLLGLHYYVHDLERSRHFYTERLGFGEIGRSSPALEQSGRQRSLVFQAGEIVIACSTPLGADSRSARYLSRHPDGIGTLAFEVDDIERTFGLLEERGATPIGDILRDKDDAGSVATFSITTPFGDTTFRFIEQRGYRGLYPGMQLYDAARGGSNPIGFSHIDHVTSNFQTMAPALLWLEHVLGLEELWEVEFHTRDVAKYEVRGGSGLRSKVMWDPKSRIKFANNEPYRPAFRSSQINQFVEDHRGDGIQHVALVTPDIISAVRALRERGVEFMSTPATYYEALPGRLAKLGIAKIDESIETLRELEILVDGHGPGRYLLQIFVKDSAALYKEAPAGPFFFELIQRKGDEGFGAGNFRALFESIERAQGGGA
jgi:4-hydroxyphenylpyruvate dioxygenase